MKKNLKHYLFFLVLYAGNLINCYAQACDPLTPSFIADLSSKADSMWLSPDTARNAYCCGTSGADACVEFIVTKNSSATGVIINIVSGAFPAGPLFIQVNCGPQIPMGDTIYLGTNGPHSITFCKPGTNINGYMIKSVTVSTSISEKNRNKTEIIISPNPSNDIIKFNSELTGKLKYRIIDFSGRIHFSDDFISVKTIDIFKLNKGIYFIEFSDENNLVEWHKIIKN